jgi:hypothetical protein
MDTYAISGHGHMSNEYCASRRCHGAALMMRGSPMIETILASKNIHSVSAHLPSTKSI